MSDDLLYAVNKQIEFSNSIKGEKHYTNSFMVLSKRGEGALIEYPHEMAACYAPLSRMRIDGSPLYIINSVQTDHPKWKKVVPDTRKAFLSYLVERSPYKDIFLIKDVDHIIEYGALCTTKVSANFLVSGLTIMRTLWEYTDVPRFWKKLVDLGVNEDMALLVAHTMGGAKKITYNQQHGGHRAFNGSTLYTSELQNFLKRKMPGALDNYHDIMTYRKIHGLWRDIQTEDFLKEYTPKHKKVVREWGEVYTERWDTTLKPFAEWLKKQYPILMGIKKPRKKPVKKAPNHKEHALIGLISQANGFTLAEVRLIRKQLREIIAGGVDVYAAGYEGWRTPERCTIMRCILWSRTPQWRNMVGGGSYWSKVHKRLQDAGAYK